MNVDITNHLVPWTQVKRMIKQAKADAWEEGFESCVEYGTDIEAWSAGLIKQPDTPPNPYLADE